MAMLVFQGNYGKRVHVAANVGFCSAGMIPLARELIKNGNFVVLASNEVPALNDITAEELKV